MSEQELRELDAWIHENVLKKTFDTELMASRDGGKSASVWEDSYLTANDVRQFVKDNPSYSLVTVKKFPHYSTDRAASQEVLERCIEKTPHTICSGKLTFPKRFVVFLGGTYEQTKQEAETLPLAICLFAEKLFEKEPLCKSAT